MDATVYLPLMVAVNFGPVFTHMDQMEARLMANMQEIQDAVARLEAATAAERAQVAAGVAAIQTEVQTLKDQLAQGGTPEERADTLARIEALITNVSAIFEEPPVPPAG